MKEKIILIGILLVLLIGGGIYLYVKKDNITNPIIHNSCLKDNEVASYEIGKNKEIIYTYIVVFDKKTGQEINRFQIQNTIDNHYHGQELHKCNFYVIRQFNYDSQTKRKTPNYSIELWSYNYTQNGHPILTFSKTDNNGNYLFSFNDDFRVDAQERYVVLIKGYLGSPDYALVIKDLKTLKDVFTLPMAEIEKKNPEIVQDIELDGWTKDGRYFWANTHYGATTLGFIRIDTTDWSVKIIPAPKDILGGDALNLENGYVTVHPGNVWFGITELEEQEKAKRRAQGIGTELYIQNLITGKRLFVDKTTEPLWYFKPQWLSDTELEYYISSGEKKIFTIH